MKGRHLFQLGFEDGKVIGIALNAAQKAYKTQSRAFKLNLLRQVLECPEEYEDDSAFWQVAKELMNARQAVQEQLAYTLKLEVPEYAVYGEECIDKGARHQMDLAMQLPIASAGALMPDAHHGYGLPIGGVLATTNAVIPYGVGVDIGCRMCLSVYGIAPSILEHKKDWLKGVLRENTRFGNKDVFSDRRPHAILERDEFDTIPFLKGYRSKAAHQIGSSGGGNHFVEFGTVTLTDPGNELGLPVGEYLGLLSHSGSRGLGAGVAKFYTDLASEQCLLEERAKHLSWLDLATEAGQEYWAAMNLAGDYASANHEHIHERISEALGEVHLGRVENHHNFAWKELDAQGVERVVHRKGATPAGKGVLGVIPGSMTAPGFIVRGKGVASALNSASHGAGRAMSRAQARNTLSPSVFKKQLKAHGVHLIGGGVDEAPMAYKNIEQVMSLQSDLVDVLGTFSPRIVRMDRH